MTLYKSVNGQQVELTPDEVAEYNSRQPSAEESLEKIKDSRKDYIIEARESYQYNNIIFENNEYKVTFKAQSKLFHLISITTGDINWRLSDDKTWVVLTKVEAEALEETITNREAESYQHESDKFLEIDNALDEETINLINWDL